MSELYLGTPAFDPIPFTRLDPIARHELGKWRTHADWSSILPTEGRVFAPHLDGFAKDELLAFGVEPNRRGDNGRDQFLVASPQKVTQVLDLRSVGEEGARRQLVEKGVLGSARGVDSIVAAFSDDQCVVLRMVRHPTASRYIADAFGLEDLPVHAFDRRVLEGDKIGEHWIAVPHITVGQEICRVNWCRDSEFLESVLKRLRRAVPHGPGSFTRAQIPQLVAMLSRADLLPSSGGDLKPLLARLKNFGPEIIANAEALAEVVELIGSFKSVDDEVRARSVVLEQEIRAELETKVLSDLQKDIKTLEADKGALQADFVALTAEAVRLREEALATESDISRARSTLVQELSTLLTELSGLSPEAEPAVEPLVRKLGQLLRKEGTEISILSRPVPPWSTPKLSSGEPSAWPSLFETLKRTSVRSGFSALDIVLADLAARSGELVVLPEDGSTFVVSYAQSIAGGNIVRQPLDPAILGLDDIRSKPSDRSPTAFAKAWSAAKLNPERFSIVLLDGIHRTPFDLWLPSLIEVLKEEARPANLLVFGTLGNEFIDRGRVWKGLADAAIALLPDCSGDQLGAIVSEAANRRSFVGTFDPVQMPRPSQQELLDAIDRSNEGFSGLARVRLLKAYAAAMPYGDAIDRFGFAAAIAGVEALGDSEAWKRRQSGDRWLHERLETAN